MEKGRRGVDRRREELQGDCDEYAIVSSVPVKNRRFHKDGVFSMVILVSGSLKTLVNLSATKQTKKKSHSVLHGKKGKSNVIRSL